MKVISTTVYTFDELSDKAKEKARDWYRYADIDSHQDTFNQVKEDAEQIGLKITYLSEREPNEGEFIDGAFNCANKILAEHGEHCETYKTAKEFLAEFDALPEGDESRADDFDGVEAEFLRSLLEDYRIMYTKECEYKNSDEYVDDNITANEYTFTADGKRFG